MFNTEYISKPSQVSLIDLNITLTTLLYQKKQKQTNMPLQLK